MRLVVLCDDRPRAPLEAEHGFSLLVEKAHHLILMDTGSSDLFSRNAEHLGVDLSGVADVVLSHGHYDHVGGLISLLKMARPRVYARREIVLPKYSKDRYIGPSYTWDEIGRSGGRLEFVEDHVVEIHDSVFAWGPARLSTSFEEPDPVFLVRDEASGELKRDLFEEELNLTLKTEEGLIVITGCAHRGIVNIVSEATELFGDRVHTVLGGFHLRSAPFWKLEKIANEFNRMGVKRLVPCHCSGEKAVRVFEERFMGEVVECRAGLEIAVD